MKILFDILGKYLVYVLIAVGIFGMIKINGCQKQKGIEALDTYKRQVQGQLTDAERELQKAHHEKGLLESELVTQKELAKRLKKDNEEHDAEFEKFKKKYKLEIQSRDRTIAALNQQIKGGETDVVIVDGAQCKILENCVVKYSWNDYLGRFKLIDPNIFEKDNEMFESTQIFKIFGEVYQQEDGSLQTRRIVLREVYKKEDGTYEAVPDAKADIIESKFEYHNPPAINTTFGWRDVFVLRPIILSSVNILPNARNIGVGMGIELLNYKGFGINSHASFNFNKVKEAGIYLGTSYRPTLFDKKLNFAIGPSIGTPFYKFGKSYSINLDLIFYLY